MSHSFHHCIQFGLSLHILYQFIDQEDYQMKSFIEKVKTIVSGNVRTDSIKAEHLNESLNQIKSTGSLVKKPMVSKFLRLLLSHRSERSVLDQPGDFVPYGVGNRKRLATCSGVSWFDDHHLAAVNLYGQHARIYQILYADAHRFEPKRLQLIHQHTEDINFPEDISISANHSYAAITNTLNSTQGVSIFKMDAVSFHFTHLISRICTEHTCHGIQFSPDSKHIVFTIISPPGSVEVYAVSDLDVQHTFSLENPDPQHRPKAACFTKDSKYIAILYSLAAGPSFNLQINKSKICIHPYSSEKGEIGHPIIAEYIHQTESNCAFEIGAFQWLAARQVYSLYITDQEDKIFKFIFDPQSLKIGLEGFYDQDIPFPHGVDISPDGHYMAVTTLGDDSIKIFELI